MGRTTALELIERLPRVPIAFLGLGMYRAWFELVFTMPHGLNGGMGAINQNLLDLVMAGTLFAFAACARKATPLRGRPGVWVAGALLLLMATIAAYASILFPAIPIPTGTVASIAGGVGLAAVMMPWLERYSQLAPVRFCLYYASAVVLSAALIWVYRGFVPSWQPWVLCLLPLVSLGLLWMTYREKERDELGGAPVEWAKFSFPWKPMLAVSLYSFAFGIQYEALAVPGLHSSPGTVVVACLVVGALVFGGRRVEFESVYSVWLPGVSAIFILIPTSGALDGAWAGFFNCGGYAASDIFLMVMTGALAWRYGVNPVWLFGIELGVRDLVLMGGRLAGEALSSAGLSSALPAMLAIIAATLVVLSEVKLDARWGIELERREHGNVPAPAPSNEAIRKNSLGIRCTQLARERGLTQREGEVLLLLAHQKTVPDIENALFIAKGTAKAHVSHVYQKLGVHSREELTALVEKSPGEG